MKILPQIYLVGSGAIGLSASHDCHIYVVDCDGELVIIDAGSGLNTNLLLDNIKAHNLEPNRITRILLTHAHPDHAAGCHYFQQKFNSKIYIHSQEAHWLERGDENLCGLSYAKNLGRYPSYLRYPACPVDFKYYEDCEFMIGCFSFKVIHIGGHSPGSVCYLLKTNTSRVLFSGDVLLYGGVIGLLNIPNSNLDEYRQNIHKLNGLEIDAFLPSHSLFTIKNGQKHIDQANQKLQEMFVPWTVGQFGFV